MKHMWLLACLCGLVGGFCSATPLSAAPTFPSDPVIRLGEHATHHDSVLSSSDLEKLLDEVVDPMTTAHLVIVVSDKAIVKINGEETYTKGKVRPYMVRGMKPGKKYDFKIVAEVELENGALFRAEKSVTLAGGQTSEPVVLQVRRVNRPEPKDIPPAATAK